MINNIYISTPYRENSIISIACGAAMQGCLKRFYTTLYFANWQTRMQRIPVFGELIAKELGRRAFPGLPPEQIKNVASLAELAHVGTNRLLGKRVPKIHSDLMYWVKARFDSAVAKNLNRESPDAFVGMYGASLESFRVVHRYGGFAILNFVNSHPVEHNRYLFELAGIKAPHHELIPNWFSRRVEEELALADLVLVPSGFVAEQLMAHGISSEKIAILPYGVDLRAFHPSQRRDPNGRTLECLYVGHISYRKGVRVLLEAAKRCNSLPVRFRLIGPIVSAEVLEGLPDNVIYEGSSLPGGVAEAMRQADLFVLPTIEDSFALVIFEAMATALPVITTTNAGASELIENEHDGLIVTPGDPVALSHAIGRLVEQPELRKRFGEAAREKVIGAHSWESYGKSVLSAIDECSKLALSDANTVTVPS